MWNTPMCPELLGEEAPGRPPKTRGGSVTDCCCIAVFIIPSSCTGLCLSFPERVERGTTVAQLWHNWQNEFRIVPSPEQAASLKLKQAESQGKGEEVRKVGRD